MCLDYLCPIFANCSLTEVFLWSDDSGDSAGASAASQKAKYNGFSYPGPHLVLQHETYASTANDVIPNAVTTLRNKGYQLVAVDTCMGSQGEWPYQYVGQPQARDSSWHC
jgi:hypothetical protein